jgi:hypothetical protein
LEAGLSPEGFSWLCSDGELRCVCPAYQQGICWLEIEK